MNGEISTRAVKTVEECYRQRRQTGIKLATTRAIFARSSQAKINTACVAPTFWHAWTPWTPVSLTSMLTIPGSTANVGMNGPTDLRVQHVCHCNWWFYKPQQRLRYKTIHVGLQRRTEIPLLIILLSWNYVHYLPFSHILEWHCSVCFRLHVKSL